MKQKKLHTAVRYALTGLTLFTTSLLVQAQEVTEETTEAKDLERIAVVGARGAPRAPTTAMRSRSLASVVSSVTSCACTSNEVVKSVNPVSA